MTIARKYDPETGLPIPPDGYFWRVQSSNYTGSPYVHLRREVNLYFFKTSYSIQKRYIPLGLTQYRLVREADKIMDWLESQNLYGDYR